MTRRPTRPTPGAASRTVVRLVAALAAALVLAVGIDAPIGAQAAPRLDLQSITPWVDGSGTFVAEFASTGLPFDGTVRVSVRQRLRGTEVAVRERLARQVRGEELGSQVASPRAARVLEVIDPAGRVRIALPLRSAAGDADRIRLPERGLYPVVIAIEAADGTPLVTRVVHLAYVGEDPPTAMGLTVLTPVRSGPVLGLDGAIDVVEAATAAQRQLDLAAAAATVPLTVDLDPEVLVGLASSPRTADRDLLDRLGTHLRSERVLRRTWAPVDVEGWADAGRSTVVRSSLDAGQQAVADHARQLVDPRVWGPDPTLGPDGLALLRGEGVTHAFVTADRLEDATVPKGETGTSRPVRITAGNGSVEALVLDPDVANLLHPSDSPGLDDGAVDRAHRALSTVLAPWFADGTARRGMAIELDATVPDDVAVALLDLLRADPPASGPALEVKEPDRLFADLDPLTVRRGGRDQPWVRTVRPPASRSGLAGLRRTADRLLPLRGRTAAVISMLPAGSAAAAQASVAIEQVVHRNLAEADRQRVLDLVDATDDRVLGAVSTPGRRTVTVTARETTIPLRLANSDDRPLRVTLRFESPRLRFEQGEVQQLLLQPGNNRVEIPVTVRSSGEFLLRTTVVTPTGGRVLVRSTIRVRSTTFSGVGLILSGGALLVLVVWWGRTVRRDGRRGEGASVADPGGDSAGDPVAVAATSPGSEGDDG